MKKILFLTGTRADYGKIKSLISLSCKKSEFDVHIFATGMHLLQRYGLTINEIHKDSFKNIYPFINQNLHDGMDTILAKTVLGLSDYVKEHQPELIFVHGDRVEALAGAIVGAMNNIRVAHIEGGEVSGTIDESIRHAISKLSHFHFVANKSAKNRLMYMGEAEQAIRIVGSPDIDIMLSPNLPTKESSLSKYQLNFKEYAIAIFHPITTDTDSLTEHTKAFFNALISSNENYIGIYPNNDHGSDIIINAIESQKNKKIKFFPSIRFENFLSLLKNAKFIIGNSSAGIREAPVYGLPSIDIGERQKNRATSNTVKHSHPTEEDILKAILELNHPAEKQHPSSLSNDFGNGNAAEKIISTMESEVFWQHPIQKHFCNV